jgi:hypothetical protein
MTAANCVTSAGENNSRTAAHPTSANAKRAPIGRDAVWEALERNTDRAQASRSHGSKCAFAPKRPRYLID